LISLPGRKALERRLSEVDLRPVCIQLEKDWISIYIIISSKISTICISQKTQKKTAQVGALRPGADGGHAPGNAAHCGAHRWLERHRGGRDPRWGKWSSKASVDGWKIGENMGKCSTLTWFNMVEMWISTSYHFQQWLRWRFNMVM
jgi:hypothetical protein